MQQGERIGLVVIGGVVAARGDCGEHLRFVRVALASGVLLDRSDGHPLVRDLVLLTSGGEVAHEPAVGMRRIDAGVATDLLEVDGVDALACCEHLS